MEIEHEIFRRRNLPHRDVYGKPFFVTACLAGSVSATGVGQIKLYRKELEQKPRPATVSVRDWKNQLYKLLFKFVDDLLDRKSPVQHLGSPAIAEVVTKSLWHFAGVRYQLYAYCIMPSHYHWLFLPLLESLKDSKIILPSEIESLSGAGRIDELKDSKIVLPSEIESLSGARRIDELKDSKIILPSEIESLSAACPIDELEDSKIFLPSEMEPLSGSRRTRTPRERIMQSVQSYTGRRCNELLGLSGPFWQHESYDHFVRDDEELLRIIHYIENNPVKAKIVTSPEQWPWSSAAHRLRHPSPPGQFLIRGD